MHHTQQSFFSSPPPYYTARLLESERLRYTEKSEKKWKWQTEMVKC